jgi:hypothetical protein
MLMIFRGPLLVDEIRGAVPKATIEAWRGGDNQGGVKGGERARGGSVSRITLGMRWADWDLQPAKAA